MALFTRKSTTTTWLYRGLLVVVSTIFVVLSNTVGPLEGDWQPKRIVSSTVSLHAMDEDASNATTATTSTTSSTNWWDPYVNEVATVYKKPKKANQWCLPEQDDVDSSLSSMTPASGLLFVKNHKSASSTGAGITKRIAIKVGARMFGTGTGTSNTRHHDMMCAHQANHGFADRRGHAWRKDPQFLWTIVREPTQRVLSGFFYFRAGKQSQSATVSSHLIPYAASERSSQLAYLQTSSSSSSFNRDRGPIYEDSSPSQVGMAAAFVKHYVFDSYQFIAVADRMAESLVVLQLLLDLKEEDVIVLSSKQAGTYTRGPNGKCQVIPPSSSSSSSPSTTTTFDMDHHYLATEFVQGNYDFLLYAAANRSLDLTIAALGNDLVQRKVQEHVQRQQWAETTCTQQAMFPCSANGTRQIAASTKDCYHLDWGCGYPCVDRVLHDYRIQQEEGNE
jgi:hypothetical protein